MKKKNNYNDIIKNIRSYYNLTQNDLSIILNINNNTIRDIEINKSKLSISLLIDIVNKFKLDLDELIMNNKFVNNKSINHFNSINNRLKYYRKKYKYSSLYLSNYLKVNKSTYLRYESGYTLINLETLLKLSTLYKISLSKFLK